MSAYFTEISAEARYTSLNLLQAEIARQAAALGVCESDRLRLQLIVEELFTNTVAHGHGGDSANRVVINLQVDGDQLLLRYRDCARRFDTTKIAGGPPLGGQIGGLGLGLVHALARAMTYRRDDDWNVTELAL